MSNARNGQPTESSDSSRRLRFDDEASIVARPDKRSEPGASTWAIDTIPDGHSGRRFVILIVCGVLLIWGILFLIFREWRSRYRVRAAYGLTRVVPVIDRFTEPVPPDVDPAAWRDAVRRTRALVATVTSSNLLDVADMDRLRVELDQAVARARREPTTAVNELAEIWNKLADRGEFLLVDNRSAGGVRHSRPAILPPRSDKPTPPATRRISK